MVVQWLGLHWLSSAQGMGLQSLVAELNPVNCAAQPKHKKETAKIGLVCFRS